MFWRKTLTSQASEFSRKECNNFIVTFLGWWHLVTTIIQSKHTSRNCGKLRWQNLVTEKVEVNAIPPQYSHPTMWRSAWEIQTEASLLRHTATALRLSPDSSICQRLLIVQLNAARRIEMDTYQYWKHQVRLYKNDRITVFLLAKYTSAKIPFVKWRFGVIVVIAFNFQRKQMLQSSAETICGRF